MKLGKYEKSFVLLVVIFLVSSYASVFAQKKDSSLIEVRLGLLQTFFTYDHAEVANAALYYALGRTSEKLKSCGYKVNMVISYAPSGDRRALMQTRTFKRRNDLWAVLGRGVIDDFYGVEQILVDIPFVALTGFNSSETGLAFTTGLYSTETAYLLKEVLLEENWGRNYGAFIDGRCVSCQQLESDFARAVESEFTRKFSIDSTRYTMETDLETLKDKLYKEPIDFLLIPNFSYFSGEVIAYLSEHFPDLKYVGTSEWGEPEWNYLSVQRLPETVEGVTVRAGVSAQIMSDFYQVYSLDRNWLNQKETASLPSFGYYIIQFFQDLTDLLCHNRPVDKEQFAEIMRTLSPGHFQLKAGTGVFKLTNNQFKFVYVKKYRK